MNRYSFLAAFLTFGLLRGLKEGMVMIKPGDLFFTGAELGVRGHAWFAQYHLLSGAVFVAFAVAILLYLWYEPKTLFLIGAAILLWQCTEMGENIARYGKLATDHEHLNMFDIISINLEGGKAYAIHAARTVTGLTLTIRRNEA